MHQRHAKLTGVHSLSLALAAVLVSIAALPSIAARAHDPLSRDPWTQPSSNRTASSSNQLGEDTRTYYLELFAHVAAVCALECWDDLVQAVQLLQNNDLSQSGADGLYDLVQSLLPTVRVTWDGTTATLLSSSYLEAAEGIERCVFVEIENQSRGTLYLSAEFSGSPPSNTAWTPPGATHGTVAQLLVDDPAATGWTLTVGSGAGRCGSLAVPVTVVQPATLLGTVRDADLDQPFPARIYVQGGDHELRHAEAYRDIPTVSEKQILGTYKSYKLPFSYCDGSFEIDVPPGSLTITMERGFEFTPVTVGMRLLPGEVRSVTLGSGRFVDMRSRGWISGETHVHWLKNSWRENEDIELLAVVQRAEDVQVVNNLTLRFVDPVTGQDLIKPDHGPMGALPGHDTGPYIIQMAEEYRNDPFYGHLVFLNLTSLPARICAPQAGFGRGNVSPGSFRSPWEDGLVQPISTGDPMGPFAEDYPVNYSRIDEALRQTPPESRPIIVSAHGIPTEVSADIVQGRIDSIDQTEPDEYYRLLDCGFRMPLTDGADHPGRLVGRTRSYVKSEGPFTYGSWIDGILNKSTFVTSGPLLLLTVNSVDVGHEVACAVGTPLNVHVEAYSRHAIGRLQVVSNHAILLDQFFAGTSAVVDFTYPADVSRWIVARCSGGVSNPSYSPVLDLDTAHTSAVYVVVDGHGIFVHSNAAQVLRDRCKSSGDYVYVYGLFYVPFPQQKREEARDYFYAGRDAYQRIIDDNP